MLTPEPSALGWWAISGESLLAMLRRCADGEDPDMVYAEEYVNADIGMPTEGGGWGTLYVALIIGAVLIAVFLVGANA